MMIIAMIENEYSRNNQKYPTTPPPNDLKSLSIDLPHQLVKGDFYFSLQQGHVRLLG
jgi:hypothetical protein